VGIRASAGFENQLSSGVSWGLAPNVQFERRFVKFQKIRRRHRA
jgi:hypothetical protein